jgi:Notch-like protein
MAPVTTKEIKAIIKSPPSGYDEIPLRILKIITPLITSPITYLCNKSISKGSFPTRLKYSQIIPIFKKGNETELTNYRPISLLTSFSKKFRKTDLLIYTTFSKHILSNKIPAKEQYEFKSNTSIIYQLTNKILKA